MLDILRIEALKAVELIKESEFIHIYTHYDADGISAAAVLASALHRLDKPFQVTFLKGLNQGVDCDADLIILADMGSGYPDIVSEIDANVVIVDHHFPTGRIEPKRSLVHVNPHLAGLDGTFELSASGTAYVVASCLGDNADLSAIALLGILGDKQKIVAGNAKVMRDGVESGHIEIVKGLNMYSGKVREVLMLSTEPFLDFYGKEGELDEFLRRVGIDGDAEIDELSGDELRRLSNAIILRLLKQGAYDGVIEEIVGERFVLKKELISNAVMFTDVINACGRASACSIGFAICMHDENYLQKGVDIWREFQIELLEELQKRREEVQEGKCIRYLLMDNAATTAPIATIISRYLLSDRPFVAVNVKNSTAKVSARSNPRINVDLGEVMRIAAERVGGRGGGHRVAAGANIPPDKAEEFVKEVDELCCAMLGSGSE
ncbi:single-stranded-DNA-specific exonuclease RecJ [Archaeoglobus veneficus]|uniref:Phosphoesterase RecJ domain protein n=1 Tax=Archaeoglobus veneficus (strain DSM 11195 / SNP6) TaxID=693661 RepID=F2KP47_ARCVS|nr:DHH family phosphoesterase [Archaeoglobus veneficus]AEA46355.1 phosphoesterase RecJ domain protein [Archaeoglobus veneficus SNP6]